MFIICTHMITVSIAWRVPTFVYNYLFTAVFIYIYLFGFFFMTRVFQKYSFTITILLIIYNKHYYIILCTVAVVESVNRPRTSLRDDEILNPSPSIAFPFHNKELYAHQIRCIVCPRFVLIYVTVSILST